MALSFRLPIINLPARILLAMLTLVLIGFGSSMKILELYFKEEKNEVADYIYEPNQQKLLDELIPLSIKTQVYKALLDSQASEHGARMTSMHKATDNATNMRDDLKLKYNKARQATITNEILEIVGGAEALNS